MASTANSVPAANGPPGNGNNSNPSSQNTGNGRQSLRTNASLKGSDSGRRQSNSPGDGTQRYVTHLTPVVRLAEWRGGGRSNVQIMTLSMSHLYFCVNATPSTVKAYLVPAITGRLWTVLRNDDTNPYELIGAPIPKRPGPKESTQSPRNHRYTRMVATNRLHRRSQ
jgi:hypothetical protein